MAVLKVGVVGCGLMGSGIAQVSAMAGFPTLVREVAQPVLDKGLASIERSLAKFVEKGTLRADEKAATLLRLRPTLRLEEFADCDVVIEAVIENLERKRELFAELDTIAKPEAVFASNTSSWGLTPPTTSLKSCSANIARNVLPRHR